MSRKWKIKKNMNRKNNKNMNRKNNKNKKPFKKILLWVIRTLLVMITLTIAKSLLFYWINDTLTFTDLLKSILNI